MFPPMALSTDPPMLAFTMLFMATSTVPTMVPLKVPRPERPTLASTVLPMATSMAQASATLAQLLPIVKIISPTSGLHTTNMLKTTTKVSTVNIVMRLDMAALLDIMIQITAPPHLTALQATVPTTPIKVMLTTLMLALKAKAERPSIIQLTLTTMISGTKATVALTITTLATDPATATLDMATMVLYSSPVNATVDIPTTMVVSAPVLLLLLLLVKVFLLHEPKET